MRSKTGLARDTSIETWSAPPMQPDVLTPTRCWPSSRKSRICSLGRKSATRMPSTWRCAVHAIAVKLLSRVTTTSARPASGWVSSYARIRLPGTGFADELGTGVVLQATSQSATPRSQPSLMEQDYRERITLRNAQLSYICPSAAPSGRSLPSPSSDFVAYAVCDTVQNLDSTDLKLAS